MSTPPTLDDSSVLIRHLASATIPQQSAAQALTTLGHLARVAADVEAAMAAAAHQARARGATWAQVGAVLSVTKQAAQQRYGTTGDPAPVTPPSGANGLAPDTPSWHLPGLDQTR